MTTTIERTSRHAATTLGSTSEADAAPSVETELLLGTETPGRPLTAPMTGALRAERVASDHQVAERAASMLMSLSSPEAMLQLAQSWIRDAQHEQREQGALTSMSSAEIDSILRERRVEEAQEAEANASYWDDVSRGLAIAAAALGTIAAVASAVVTGGAGIIAAVGIAVAVLGPLIAGELQRAGAISGDESLAMSTVCVVVGTAFSFGAGAVGGTAGAVGAGANAVSTAAQVGAAAAQVGAAATEMGSAQYTRDASDRIADSVAAGHDVEAHQAEVEEEVGDLRALQRTFARIAEKLRATALARGEAMRAAVGTRA